MRENIIHTAAELFLNYGFKSVTMDDIANAMGISKKTIYTHFENKTALVHETTLSIFNVISNAVNQICSVKKNPIEEIYEVKQMIMEHLKNEKTSPQYQLQKYYPNTFNTLKKKQFEMIQSCVSENLSRGIELGIYRANININFICKIYFHTLLNIRDNEIFPLNNNSLSSLLEQFYEYHLRGICTDLGLKILHQFINKTIENHQ